MQYGDVDIKPWFRSRIASGCPALLRPGWWVGGGLPWSLQGPQWSAAKTKTMDRGRRWVTVAWIRSELHDWHDHWWKCATQTRPLDPVHSSCHPPVIPPYCFLSNVPSVPRHAVQRARLRLDAPRNPITQSVRSANWIHKSSSATLVCIYTIPFKPDCMHARDIHNSVIFVTQYVLCSNSYNYFFIGYTPMHICFS